MVIRYITKVGLCIFQYFSCVNICENQWKYKLKILYYLTVLVRLLNTPGNREYTLHILVIQQFLMLRIKNKTYFDYIRRKYVSDSRWSMFTKILIFLIQLIHINRCSYTFPWNFYHKLFFQNLKTGICIYYSCYSTKLFCVCKSLNRQQEYLTICKLNIVMLCANCIYKFFKTPNVLKICVVESNSFHNNFIIFVVGWQIFTLEIRPFFFLQKVKLNALLLDNV